VAAVGHHDQAFRALLNEPGALEALLRERLPPEVVQRFAGAPVKAAESLVDRALRAHFADVVAQVPLQGGEQAWVFVLIEHKRKPGRQVLVQLLRYMTNLYERFERQAKGGKLPAILCLVVYNGETRWTGPTRFSELLDVDGPLGALVLDFPVVVVDLGAEASATLAKHPALKGGLLALKAAAAVGAEQRRIAREAFRLFADDEWTRDLYLRYLGHVGGKKMESTLMRAAREELRPGEENAVQTLVENWLSQGRRQGRRQGLTQGLTRGLEQGRTQGLEQGRAEALREVVTALLTKRFKKVPAKLKARLADADAKTLQRWFDAAYDAPSIEAVFKA
jgi:predicted transposase/invertase (TIGR01784 family)